MMRYRLRHEQNLEPLTWSVTRICQVREHEATKIERKTGGREAWNSRGNHFLDYELEDSRTLDRGGVDPPIATGELARGSTLDRGSRRWGRGFHGRSHPCGRTLGVTRPPRRPSRVTVLTWGLLRQDARRRNDLFAELARAGSRGRAGRVGPEWACFAGRCGSARGGAPTAPAARAVERVVGFVAVVHGGRVSRDVAVDDIVPQALAIALDGSAEAARAGRSQADARA